MPGSVRTYYIAGVPASGKSSIIRQVISDMLPNGRPFQAGKLHGINEGPIYVFGQYDGGKFDGTDRLAMDVINDAITFADRLGSTGQRCAILVEGDRLFNRRFLEATAARIIVIDAPAAELRRRHAARRDTQSQAFIKATRTKLENIIRAYGLKRFINDTPEAAARLITWLEGDITKWIKDGSIL